MSSSQEGIYHLRGFEDLIYDAVHLLYLAHDVDVENDQDLYERTYIRTSILKYGGEGGIRSLPAQEIPIDIGRT
jgi:hypothetical protein